MTAPRWQDIRARCPPGPVDRPRLERQRLDRLRSVLAAADLAGAVFFDPINIRYATGISNMQVWCLHNPTRYCFVATDGPVVQFEFPSCNHLAAAHAGVDEVRPAHALAFLMTGPDGGGSALAFAAEIADLVARHGGGNRRLAVDRLDPPAASALAALGIAVEDGQAVAERARVLKTPEEIAAIRDAVAACEAAVRAMHHHVAPGLTEREVWSVLHQQSIANGGEWIETRLLASGPRTNPWYQECSDRVIGNGDVVALDTDLIGRNGYCCDISRTWVAGDRPVDDPVRRTHALAFRHLQRLLGRLGPGVPLRALAETAGDVPEGYHAYSCLIHGIGLCDEYPVAFWRDAPDFYDATILPGMTLCAEAYFGPTNGGPGVKLEEQVLITDSGIELLSTLPFDPRLS